MDHKQYPQAQNFAGKIARAFVSNRPLSYLLLLTSIAVGVFGFLFTPKQYNPDITLPAFEVRVEYPGATAAEVETFVLQELEEKMLDIPGVDEIATQAVDGGVGIVRVQFYVGEDLEQSKVRLQTKLAEHDDLARGMIESPQVSTIDPDLVPIITLGFHSDRFTQNELRTKVVDVARELKTVPGVANLNVHGGERRALRVMLDLAAMEARQVTVTDVERAFEANNILVHSGAIKNGSTQHVIDVDGTIKTMSAAEDIIVRPGVKVADIADLRDAYTDKTAMVFVSRPDAPRDEAVFLSIAKKKGESAITVAEQVYEKLDLIMEKSAYDDMTSEIYRDEAAVASRAINGLAMNLVTSIAIVSLILLLFLGGRSAAIVAIAIPLTLAWVFFIGLLFGETINRITLFALILSLGLLVDSATVVVENIYRHIQSGAEKVQAIVRAVDEVGIGLLLSTITSVIVFLPTARVTGMMGEYMGPLSFFVPVALIVSLFIAVMLTPFLSGLLIRKQGARGPSRVQRLFDRVADRYARVLHHLLSSRVRQRRFLFGVFALLIVVMVFPVVHLVHFRMLPTADKEQFYIYMDAPEGIDMDETDRQLQTVLGVVMETPQVQSVQVFLGEAPIIDFNGLYKNAGARSAPHMATARVNLTLPAERPISSEEIVADLRHRLHADTSVVRLLQNGTSVRLLEDPPGPPVQATFLAKVQGGEKRDAFAQMTAALAREIDGVVDVDTTVPEGALRSVLHVNHEKALASGVNTAAIASALRSTLHGTVVGQYHVPGYNEMTFIELHTPIDKRDSTADLHRVTVRGANGDMVPLMAIVDRVDTRVAPLRYRDNGRPTSYVMAEMENRSVVYAVIDVIQYLREHQQIGEFQLEDWGLFAIDFVDSEGEPYRIAWGGEWKMTLENFRDLGLAMLVAFLLIYMVLVAQFRSFGAPALIMVTIPLAFIGILPGFAVLDAMNGTFLTATTLIGFIALMGIVVNNAILYLEYVDQRMQETADLKTALIDAGKTRLRPILLTSLTTVLGSLTIASDPVWSGLAWAIVFGLSLSAVLTLAVFPVLYYRIRPNRGHGMH